MSKKPIKSKKRSANPAPGGASASEADIDASSSHVDIASWRCLRLGWIMVALFMALGLILESLHLVKLPFYLDVHLRRELWTLAHAHGTLLGAINVLFGLSAGKMIADDGRRLTASRALRTGTLMIPIGFFLGALGNTEGDPSLFILLVPTGALLALVGVLLLVLSSRRG